MFKNTGIAVILMTSLLAGVLEVSAQRPPSDRERREGDPVLRIRRLPRLDRGMLVRTPEYQATGASSPRNPREWAHIEVEFETYPDWIDEVTFTYYVVSQADERMRGEGEPEFSFYETGIRYGDIAAGTRKRSSVFLTPAAVARYGLPVAVALEVTYDGEIVAEDQVTAMTLPENWWRDSDILQSENLIRRDGYLLERSQTPFSLLNWDDYEVAR